MPKPTPHYRVLFGRTLVAVLLGVALSVLLPLASFVNSSNSLTAPFAAQQVSAATNATINYQARLLNSGGGIVPDGNYHIEFKLYNASAADSGETPLQGSCTTNPGAAADEDCLWTETRTTGNLVRVVNGYFSVNLGSVTAFGSSINWDDELWLTMNIGGNAGTAAWDGEMTPRVKLTAVPYAKRAGILVKQDSGFKSTLSFATPTANRTITLADESGTVCLNGSASCGFATGSGTAVLQNGNSLTADLTVGTNDAHALNLETGGTTRLAISSTGSAVLTGGTSGVALTVNNSTSTGNILNLQDNGTNVVTVADGGAVLLKNAADSAAGLQVRNAADKSVLTVDTTGGEVELGTAGVGGVNGKLLFNNDTTSSTITLVSSAPLSSYSLTLPSSAPGTGQCVKTNAVTASQLEFGSCATGSGVTTVGALNGGTANANGATIDGTTIYLQSASASYAGLVDTGAQTFAGAKTFTGAALFQNSADSTTAFQVQNSAGASILGIDTTGQKIGIGTTSASALLHLKGNLTSALTGTVAVTNASTTVTGTGTAFTTELAVGDSIKIGTEVFTVAAIGSATSLTLDSAYAGATASGLTAYRDPNLLAIDNGDGVNKLTVTRSGGTGIGTASPAAKLHVVTSETTTDGVLFDASSVTTGNALRVLVSGTNMTNAGTALSVMRDSTVAFDVDKWGNTRFVEGKGQIYGDGGSGIVLDSWADVRVVSGSAAGRVYIGNSDTTGTSLVLDTKTDAGDPTGVNGGMYYNSNAGKFRCYQAAAWTDCITAADGGVTTVGTFSSTSIANGASISGNTITLGVADATNPGMVSTAAQTIAGAKTFNDLLTASAGISSPYRRSNTGVQDSAGTAGWRNIGTFAAGGAGERIKLRILGAGGYGQVQTEYGETVILASIGNNASATTANIQGAWYSVGGDPVVTDVKFVENGSRTTYDVYANFETFSRHTVLADLRQGTWTNAWTSVTDPGADSATVKQALNQHNVTANSFIKGGITGVALTVSNGTSTGNILNLQDNGTDVLTVADGGAVLLKNTTNSTAAFQVQNASSAAVLTADTTNARVGIGTAAPVTRLHVSDGKAISSSLYFSNTDLLVSNEGRQSTLQVTIASDTASHKSAFGGSRARGTLNAPLAVQSGDSLFSVQASGYDGTNLVVGAGIDFEVDGTVGSNSVPTSLALVTGSNSSRQARLTVSSGGTVTIGASDTTGSLLVFDTKTDAGDPTGVNGGMYYNSNSGKLRCYEAGAWKDCGGVNTVGTFSSSSIANGASISGNTITLGVADATNPGMISTTAQTIAGAKTFTGAALFRNAANSATAFQIQNDASGAVLTVDTTTSKLTINQGGLDIRGLANPAAPSLTSAATGGSLAAATYTYRLAATGPAGETQAVASSPTNVTTTGTTSVNTLSWSAVTYATGYRVYRSTDGGTTWFVNAVAAGTTSITDNGTNFTWTTAPAAGLPDYYSNATADLQMADASRILLSNGKQGQLKHDIVGNSVVLANYQASGSVILQGASFMFQDTTGYNNNLYIGDSGQALFKNRTDSTTAFQVQDQDAVALLTADTTNMVVKVGTTSAASYSGAKLVTTVAEVTTAIRIGTSTDGVEFTASGAPVYRGTARPTKTIKLAPEYAGAVMTGTSTSGTMTSDFCSGTSRKSVNTANCAATDEHNYYQWTSTASGDFYDIYINGKMPSDFDGFASSTSISMFGWRTDATVNKVELSLFNSSGAECGTTTQVAGDAAWASTALTGDETALAACTAITADSDVVWRVRVTADASDYVRAGAINFSYRAKF